MLIVYPVSSATFHGQKYSMARARDDAILDRINDVITVCARRCKATTSCTSFNYHRFRFCELLNLDPDLVSLELSVEYDYYVLDNWGEDRVDDDDDYVLNDDGGGDASGGIPDISNELFGI